MQKKNSKLVIILAVMAAVFLVLYFTVLRSCVLKLRYKLPYKDLILASAEEFHIDPTLAAAVILSESGYNPNAKSRVGATGLMQLMPATAAEAAQTLGIEGYSEEMLTDPAINIRLGCYYLSSMLAEFGSVKNTLCAYNAGPGRTKSWIKDYGVNAQNEVMYIPYPETETYVGRVTSTMKIYGKLYPELAGNAGKEQ